MIMMQQHFIDSGILVVVIYITHCDANSLLFYYVVISSSFRKLE